MPPRPRQRLYTAPRSYFGILRDVAVRRAMRGADTATLERDVCAFTGAHSAAAVSMARSGIYLLLRVLLQPGQEVVLSPYTIADVVNMVVCAGGRPVFADVEARGWNIDPAELEAAVTPRTGLVLATHFYGQACAIERIAEFCRLKGLLLVEDCAQAFGTSVGGRRAGSFGDAGVFSFGLFKNVTSFVGGMVVARDAGTCASVSAMLSDRPFEGLGNLLARLSHGAIIDAATYPPLFGPVTFPVFRLARLRGVEALERQFAFDRSPQLKRQVPPEYLRRMTPAQARVLLPQIGQVDRNARARVSAAKIYHDGLCDIAELVLPPLRDDGSHVYQYFPVQFERREALVTHALRYGRDIAVSHHRNCAAIPCFAEFARPCPNAARADRDTFYLPTYPRYPESEVRENVRVIRQFFGR